MKINKNNNSKKMIIHKKSLARLIKIFVGTFFITGCSSAFNPSKDEVPVKISSSIYESIKNDYNLPENIKIDSKNLEIEEANLDLSITNRTLSYIEHISVDALESDFNDLLLLTSLKDIEISNFQYLSVEAKEIIRKHPTIKSIKLIVENIYPNFLSLSDVNWINNSQIIDIKMNVKENSDLADLYLYKAYLNLDYEIKSKLSFKKFSKQYEEEIDLWDEKINQIIKSLNFEEETTNEEKIIKIIGFVTKYLDYDPQVLNNSENSDNLSTYYNYNILKSFFDEYTGYGVCCNFAALTTVLASYANIDLDYVRGKTSTNTYHAWCEYDGIKIDPTSIDDSIDRFIDQVDIDKYISSFISSYFVTFCDERYNSDKPIKKMGVSLKKPDIILEKPININYINENSDKYKYTYLTTENKDEKIFYLIPIFCLLYNIIEELKDEQETKKTKQYKKKKNK